MITVDIVKVYKDLSFVYEEIKDYDGKRLSPSWEQVWMFRLCDEADRLKQNIIVMKLV